MSWANTTGVRAEGHPPLSRERWQVHGVQFHQGSGGSVFTPLSLEFNSFPIWVGSNLSPWCASPLRESGTARSPARQRSDPTAFSLAGCLPPPSPARPLLHEKERGSFQGHTQAWAEEVGGQGRRENFGGREGGREEKRERRGGKSLMMPIPVALQVLGTRVSCHVCQLNLLSASYHLCLQKGLIAPSGARTSACPTSVHFLHHT